MVIVLGLTANIELIVFLILILEGGTTWVLAGAAGVLTSFINCLLTIFFLSVELEFKEFFGFSRDFFKCFSPLTSSNFCFDLFDFLLTWSSSLDDEEEEELLSITFCFFFDVLLFCIFSVSGVLVFLITSALPIMLFFLAPIYGTY